MNIVIRENGKHCMTQMPVKIAEQIYRGNSHLVFQSVCDSVLWKEPILLLLTQSLTYKRKMSCIVRCKCLWQLLSGKMASNAWFKCLWKNTSQLYQYTAASVALFFTMHVNSTYILTWLNIMWWYSRSVHKICLIFLTVWETTIVLQHNSLAIVKYCI